MSRDSNRIINPELWFQLYRELSGSWAASSQCSCHSSFYFPKHKLKSQNKPLRWWCITLRHRIHSHHSPKSIGSLINLLSLINIFISFEVSDLPQWNSNTPLLEKEKNIAWWRSSRWWSQKLILSQLHTIRAAILKHETETPTCATVVNVNNSVTTWVEFLRVTLPLQTQNQSGTTQTSCQIKDDSKTLTMEGMKNANLLAWGEKNLFLPSILFKLQAKEPKAVIKVDTINATFQPEKIGHPNGLQITYLRDYSTRNIFVYHDNGKVLLPQVYQCVTVWAFFSLMRTFCVVVVGEQRVRVASRCIPQLDDNKCSWSSKYFT